MDKNLIWQYTAVALLLLAAIARMIWSIRRKGRKGGCCTGCSLAETCRDNKATSRSPSKPPTRHCP